MCWTPEASLTLGVAGVATAAYCHRRGESKELTLPLLYFSLMEFIQAASYPHIGQCFAPSNQFLTFISYLHIAFQPIFFNMIYIQALPRALSAAAKRYVYAAALGFSALFLIKIVPLVPLSICKAGATLCGPAWCTIDGSWHIGWSMPWYTFPLPGDLFLYYAAAVFVLPLFYGAWRGVLLALGGLLLAYLSAPYPNEWPAIWCFFSVGLMLLLMAKDYRRYLGRRGKRSSRTGA